MLKKDFTMYQITPHSVSSSQLFVSVQANQHISSDAADALISNLMRMSITDLGIHTDSLNTEEFFEAITNLEINETMGVYIAHHSAGYPDIVYGKTLFLSPDRVEFIDNHGVRRHVAFKDAVTQ